MVIWIRVEYFDYFFIIHRKITSYFDEIQNRRLFQSNTRIISLLVLYASLILKHPIYFIVVIFLLDKQ